MKSDKQGLQSSKCVAFFFKNIYNVDVNIINPTIEQVADKVKSMGRDFPMLFLLYTGPDEDVREFITEVAGVHIVKERGRYMIIKKQNNNLHVFYVKTHFNVSGNYLEISDNNRHYYVYNKELVNFNFSNIVAVYKLI